MESASRRINWLYRVDSLRNHDMHEMQMYWELTTICEGYATQFILWAYSIKAFIQMSMDSVIISKLEIVLTIITKMIEMF